MLYPWFHYSLDGITVATLGIQFYLLWLILFKTPKRMASFRYSLFMLMQNEIFLNLVIGVGLNPDLMLEAGVQGAIINGVARFIGPEGGRIGFAMALFFGAGVFNNQIYCLIFRYTAIQQNYPKLHEKFNKWRFRFCFALIHYSIAIFCAILAFQCMADLKRAKELIDHPLYMPELVPKNRIENPELFAKIAENDTVFVVVACATHKDGYLINGPDAIRFGILVIGGYVFFSILSIAFSVMIYRTISRNAAHFTAKTYRLHLQLTALLIIQFCLPALFLIFPLGYIIAAFAAALSILNETCQKFFLLLALFTLANSLCTLLFISPYRNYTFRWLRLKKVSEERKEEPALKTTKNDQISLNNNQIMPMAEAPLSAR